MPLLPTPIQPTATRLLGAAAPKTDDGTIAGTARLATVADLRNLRRVDTIRLV